VLLTALRVLKYYDVGSEEIKSTTAVDVEDGLHNALPRLLKKTWLLRGEQSIGEDGNRQQAPAISLL
jgi:hypothetical protein